VTETFFVPAAGGAGSTQRFEAGHACVGPWSADLMHGGPPAALLVRACETAAATAGARGLVALTADVEFLSPVPLGPVEVRTRILRPGRRITLAEATMSAAGRDVLTARTWLVRPADAGAETPHRPPEPPPGDPARPPVPLDCPPTARHWTVPYALAIEWRSVSGDAVGPGDAASWTRLRIPLVPGEEPSGLQRAVVVADSGNGISAALDWEQWSFVNIDLDVRLSRPLVGEWVLLDARTRYQPSGTGLASSVLSDEYGVVGAGAQTLVITPR
jgi:hypothetical protein